MRAIVLLLVVTMLGVSGCRKEPAAHSKPKPPATGESRPQTSASTTTAAGAKRNAPPKPAIDRNAQVIVLGYHRFVEKVRRPDTEITPEDFEKQMQALKDDGIRVISLKQFLAWRRGDENIPPRSALITIDDGYASGHDIAWPILKKFGYPFSLFIYTDYVKGGPKSGGASMTWEQLAEMRDAGVSIQSHTVSHSDLRAKHHKGQDYEAWLWNELNGSKEVLEERLGIKVSALAVPYGRFDAHVQEIAAKAGYEMLFMVNGEKLGFDTPANALGRYMIQSNEPKIFASAVTFESRASSGGIAGSAAPGGALAIDTPLLEPEPPDSATITNERPLIRASLATLGEIEPGSVAMRLSGVGLLPAKFDPVAQGRRLSDRVAAGAGQLFGHCLGRGRGPENGRPLEIHSEPAVASGDRERPAVGGPLEEMHHRQVSVRLRLRTACVLAGCAVVEGAGPRWKRLRRAHSRAFGSHSANSGDARRDPRSPPDRTRKQLPDDLTATRGLPPEALGAFQVYTFS